MIFREAGRWEEASDAAPLNPPMQNAEMPLDVDDAFYAAVQDSETEDSSFFSGKLWKGAARDYVFVTTGELSPATDVGCHIVGVYSW